MPEVCNLSNITYLRHAYWKFISPDPDAKATGYQDSDRSGRAGANLQIFFYPNFFFIETHVNLNIPPIPYNIMEPEPR